MNNKDHGPLKHLTFVKLDEREDLDTYVKTQTLVMRFSENEFFENEELTIVVTLNKDMVKLSKGTEI